MSRSTTRATVIALLGLSFATWTTAQLKPGGGPARRWEFAAGGAVNTMAAVGPDGTVYFGCADHSVYAVDPATGIERWRFETLAPVRVAPCVGTDGAVYVGGHEGVVYAVDARTGKQLWAFRVEGAPASPEATQGDPSAPGRVPTEVTRVLLGAGGVVYAITSDSTLYALDSRTGRKRTESANASGSAGLAASPRGTTLYLTQGGGKSGAPCVLALDAASGGRRWRLPVPAGKAQSLTPGLTVSADGTVYAAGYGDRGEHGILFAISSDGRFRWQLPLEHGLWPSSPSVGPDGALYVVTSNSYYPRNPSDTPAFVYSVDAAAGAIRWVVSPGPLFMSSPCVTADGVVVIRHERGLSGLSPVDGHTVWSYPAGEGTGAVLGANGDILFGVGSRLVALAPAR